MVLSCFLVFSRTSLNQPVQHFSPLLGSEDDVPRPAGMMYRVTTAYDWHVQIYHRPSIQEMNMQLDHGEGGNVPVEGTGGVYTSFHQFI